MLLRFINKKDLCCKKVEKLKLHVCKRVLGINKNLNNMKVLTEIGRVPLKINIET